MPESTDIGGVKISSASEYIMIGSSVELSPVYHDRSYRPFIPESTAVFYENHNNGNARGVFENNVFTATKKGVTSLVAENEGIKGILDITVLSSPDEFIFKEIYIMLSFIMRNFMVVYKSTYRANLHF